MAISSIGAAPTPGADRGRDLAVFDGFPYLVIRVVSALYHITLLPGDAGERDLAGLARAQWGANRLDVCLVTGPERALYITADGREGQATTPPQGGIPIAGRLKPPTTWPDTRELHARQDRLARFLEARALKSGSLFGDLTKGGRDATADEVGRLAGPGPEGAPRGLARCAACGDWRGSCLDPSPEFFGKLMTVHCRCDNHNRCAACGRPLYERRLNANYYDPRDRRIWHVPGFSGLAHQCPPAPGAAGDPLFTPAR
jgi:hypothetical protein